MISDQVAEMLRWGKTQIGKPYITDPKRRFGPVGYDCSGFVVMCAAHVGVHLSATNSADIARMCRDLRTLLSLDQALRTPGSILLMGPNHAYDGYGPSGHILFVAENGLTLESSGSRGVNQRPISTFNWPYMFRTGNANAAYVPGINYNQPAMIDWNALIVMMQQREDSMSERGLAVDFAINPANPTQGYVLDRFGGIQGFGGAVAFPQNSGPYWPQQDVARKLVVTDWVKPKGYIMDLWGGKHPINGAPKLIGGPYFKGLPEAKPA